MTTKIKETNINYIEYGADVKTTLVFLHGWGQNIAMMQPLADPFKNEYHILIVDLPGYGESSEPSYAWSNEDYAECLHELFLSLKIEKPVLIGHSFGGKLSLVYATKYEVSKLILLGSPYKPEITKLSVKTKVLKQLKKVPGLNKLEQFAKRHIGSTDYRQASVRMREILVKTIGHDLTLAVKKISCPTLLVWGTLDDAVPLERAYELEKLIPNAGVVTYEGASHYAYLEHLRELIPVLFHFIRSEE